MKQFKVSLWERIKRIVAHSFNLETEQEIQERIERKKFEMEQAELRYGYRQYIKGLMAEFKEEIEAHQRMKEEQKAKEEEERRRQEAIQLYRDNRKRQSTVYYREVEEEETTEQQ